MTTRPAILAQRVAAALYTRLRQLRADPQRGSHAVEYAIGIGLGAAAILIVFAALKTDLGKIISSWVFTLGK